MINNYLINKYLIRIKSREYYLFSSHYVLIFLISFLTFYFNQNLIENSFGQFCFAIGFCFIIICLTFIEEKEMIHYIYCVWKLNYQDRKSEKKNRN